MVHWGFLILAFLLGIVAGWWMLVAILKKDAELASAIESVSRSTTPPDSAKQENGGKTGASK